MTWRRLAPGAFDPERIFGVLGYPLLWVSSWLAVFGLPQVRTLPCLFRAWTGLPCPTCGASRAFAVLLEGRLREAFLLQPLIVALAMAYTVYAAYAVVVLLGGFPRLRIAGRVSPRLWLAAGLTLLAANWIYVLYLHGPG